MAMQIFDCEQGSPEWFECRRGIPTASEFSTVLTKGRSGQPSKTRRKYMMRLAGEILTGENSEGFTSYYTERGKMMEDEARKLYSFLNNNATLHRVGFVRNGNAGCSPDSLVGDVGSLEIKSAQPEVLLDALLDVIDKGEFPPEHYAQCQGVLWIAEREWIDILGYWPTLSPLQKRVYRDEPYIKNLSDEVDRFNDELASAVERFRKYSMQEAA